jgi:hypothetical protein
MSYSSSSRNTYPRYRESAIRCSLRAFQLLACARLKIRTTQAGNHRRDDDSLDSECQPDSPYQCNNDS